MGFWEKSQSLIILAAVFIGLALGQIAAAAEQAGRFILPFLLLMLLGVFLQLPLRQLANAWKHGRLTGLNLLINFVWNPPLAWFICYPAVLKLATLTTPRSAARRWPVTRRLSWPWSLAHSSNCRC
jgi:ACR3 family arsenite efflux pump ArsB